MSRTTFSLLRTTLYLNAVLALIAAPPAAAQGLGGLLKKKLKEKIEHATERGVDRAADEAEEVIRCAVGDAACVGRAKDEGKQVVLVEEGAERTELSRREEPPPESNGVPQSNQPSAEDAATAAATSGSRDSSDATGRARAPQEIGQAVQYSAPLGRGNSGQPTDTITKRVFDESAFLSLWQIDSEVLDRFENALAGALRGEDYLKAGNYSAPSVLVMDWMRILGVFTQEHFCPQSSRVASSVRSRHGGRMEPPPQIYSPFELETVRPRCARLAEAIDAVLTNKAR